MTPQSILHDGKIDPVPRSIELRAGPLTMLFEPHTAFLRHIRLGDHEVVRALYAAVRDQNWATIPPRVANLKSEIARDSFRLTFEVACRRGEIDYGWQGTMTGEANGRIKFSFDGEARSDFLRNRIGICILHPIAECGGIPCAIEHVDGRIEEDKFPTTISPYQPFQEIRAISYEVATTGIRAQLEVEGDTFEMEDQRNWSDASFKTYCTPLALPLPAPVKTGDRAQQVVTLTLSGPVRPILPVNLGRAPQLSISTTPVVALPPIGLCAASHGRPLSGREIERLKWLRLSHLRLDLELSSPHYRADLERVTQEADQLGVGLHLALTLSENADEELRLFAGHLDQVKPRVLFWIILHQTENPATEQTVQRARPVLQKYAPSALLAAGTKDFFTEVNRVRLAPGATSFVCYSTNPQVHAFDNTTLVRIRNNAAARGESAATLSELPSDVDPRQTSLFGGGWTLGSIARLATTGFVHSLTYFETTGWRGVMETEAGPPLPEKFPSAPGTVFPMFHVLADIAEFPSKQIYPTHSSHPLLVAGLTLFDTRGRRRILVANLTGEPQDAKIKTGTCQARVRQLDETNAEAAMRDPEAFRAQADAARESLASKIELQLLPYAIARLDIG